MTALQIVGALMLLSIFGFFFVMTARDLGWLEAVGMWTFSLALTALIAVGVCLMTGDLP